MKSLIIFYSLEGNTKYIAEEVAKILDSDVLQLKPKKELDADSFTKYMWGGRQVVMKETPDLIEYDVDFEKYDLLIIGTPVWAFTFTPPIRTFLKENKISGKKIAFFCTHEGGMGKTLDNLINEFKDNNEIVGTGNFKNVLKNKDEMPKLIGEFVDGLKI